jgi:hypothetical protein
MKKRIKILGIVALLLALAAVLMRSNDRDEALNDHGETTSPPKSSGIPSASPPIAGGSTSPADPLKALMQTPIEFYGLVLDQDGNPVPSAKVEASVLDNMIKGTPITTITGADGRFSIKSKGASLHILVSKSGYYYVDESGLLRPSSQGFDFGVDNGRGVYQPNAASPSVFHLRKAGNPVQLDILRGQSKVPRDGSPLAIGLSKTDNLALHVRCRTLEDATQPPNAPYDWHCEIILEGGGIQEAQDEHSFIAPSEGYAPLAVIDMPKTLDRKQWQSRANKNYWLHFSDNTFGRITFMMNARGDHFAEINGFRNPRPNDRNLEPKLESR